MFAEALGMHQLDHHLLLLHHRANQRFNDHLYPTLVLLPYPVLFALMVLMLTLSHDFFISSFALGG